MTMCVNVYECNALPPIIKGHFIFIPLFGGMRRVENKRTHDVHLETRERAVM